MVNEPLRRSLSELGILAQLVLVAHQVYRKPTVPRKPSRLMLVSPTAN